MRQTKVRLAAGAILGVTFFGGLAVGLAFDRGVGQAVTDPEMRRDSRRENTPPPSGWIVDRLELTDAQRANVDSVVAHFGSHMGDLQREYRPRFQAVVDSTSRALRSALTPEQLAHYDSIEAVVRSRRPRGNPPGPR
jgi:hypothetical protein